MDNRTQLDAVHEAFKAVQYHCVTCAKNFKAQDIRKHYKNHMLPLQGEKCAYCHEPCYPYRTNTGENKTWHVCPRS